MTAAEAAVAGDPAARAETIVSNARIFLGRYSFAARPPREGLRPLRDPATVHRDEDDEGTGE